MRGFYFLDGTANAPRHRGSGTFGWIPQFASAARKPCRPAQLFNDLIKFRLRRFGSAGIIVCFRLFELLLQLLDAVSVCTAGIRVEQFIRNVA